MSFAVEEIKMLQDRVVSLENEKEAARKTIGELLIDSKNKDEELDTFKTLTLALVSKKTQQELTRLEEELKEATVQIAKYVANAHILRDEKNKAVRVAEDVEYQNQRLFRQNSLQSQLLELLVSKRKVKAALKRCNTDSVEQTKLKAIKGRIKSVKQELIAETEGEAPKPTMDDVIVIFRSLPVDEQTVLMTKTLKYSRASGSTEMYVAFLKQNTDNIDVILGAMKHILTVCTANQFNSRMLAIAARCDNLSTEMMRLFGWNLMAGSSNSCTVLWSRVRCGLTTFAEIEAVLDALELKQK